MICALAEVEKNIRIAMEETIDSYSCTNIADESGGLKCEACGFIKNDQWAHYCGKCGQPLQFMNRFKKWNK